MVEIMYQKESENKIHHSKKIIVNVLKQLVWTQINIELKVVLFGSTNHKMVV